MGTYLDYYLPAELIEKSRSKKVSTQLKEVLGKIDVDDNPVLVIIEK